MIGSLYTICQWVARLAYANLLWVALSAAGLVFFGLMPATAALFHVTGRWNRGDTEFAVARTFWHIFRGDFLKSNLYGWMFAILGLVLVFDLRILGGVDEPMLQILRLFILIVSYVYLIAVFYAFPVLAEYDLPVSGLAKLVLIVSLSQPLKSLMMAVGVAGCIFVFRTLPGLIPFFCASAPAFWISWIATHAFARLHSLENKRRER